MRAFTATSPSPSTATRKRSTPTTSPVGRPSATSLANLGLSNTAHDLRQLIAAGHQLLAPGIIKDVIGSAHHQAAAEVAVGHKRDQQAGDGVVAEPFDEGAALSVIGQGGQRDVNLRQLEGFEVAEECVDGIDGGRFPLFPASSYKHGLFGLVG